MSGTTAKSPPVGVTGESREATAPGVGIHTTIVGAEYARSLAGLHRQCFAEAWSDEEIRTLIETLGAFAILAVVADDPVGFALVLVVRDEGEILAFGMVPEHRQRGIATGLLAALTRRLADLGARRLVLEVAADNPAARALYAAAGFVPVGRRRGYYERPGSDSIDALILAREIRPLTTEPAMPCATAAGADRADPQDGPDPAAKADPRLPGR